MGLGRKEGSQGSTQSLPIFSATQGRYRDSEHGAWKLVRGDLWSWCVKVKSMGRVESRESIRPAEGLEERDLILSHLCCLSGL